MDSVIIQRKGVAKVKKKELNWVVTLEIGRDVDYKHQTIEETMKEIVELGIAIEKMVVKAVDQVRTEVESHKVTALIMQEDVVVQHSWESPEAKKARIEAEKQTGEAFARKEFARLVKQLQGDDSQLAAAVERMAEAEKVRIGPSTATNAAKERKKAADAIKPLRITALS